MCIETVLRYTSILSGKGILAKLKLNYTKVALWSCLIYGSEMWPMEVEYEVK